MEEDLLQTLVNQTKISKEVISIGSHFQSISVTRIIFSVMEEISPKMVTGYRNTGEVRYRQSKRRLDEQQNVE